MKNFNPEDVELAKEIGFKIHDSKDHGHEFEVIIEMPDREKTHRAFTFSRNNGLSWTKEVEWVENGEKKKMVRWKKHIADKLRDSLEAVEAKQNEDIDVQKGERLELE